MPRIKQCLATQGIAFPTYTLDLATYGDEFSPGKRYQQFLAQLYPGHPEVLGLPTHLVLNREQ